MHARVHESTVDPAAAPTTEPEPEAHVTAAERWVTETAGDAKRLGQLFLSLPERLRDTAVGLAHRWFGQQVAQEALEHSAVPDGHAAATGTDHAAAKAPPAPADVSPAPKLAPAPKAAPTKAAPAGPHQRTVEGATTLDVAMTRLDPTLGETHYTLNGQAMADTQAYAANVKKLADDEKALKKTPDSDDLKTEIATLKAATADYEKAAATSSTAHAKALASGNKDQTNFHCSGFQLWTLAATGYDVEKPLTDAEGNQIYGEIPVPGTGKDGKPRPPKKVFVTLQKLIEGYPDAVEIMAKARAHGTTNGSVGPIEGTGFETADGNGETLAVSARGAAGAFELAGIGKQVPADAQKPGDFAQGRDQSAGKGKDTEVKHRGKGHAWQVASVTVKGAAMFGAEGSPRTDKPLTGWHEDVVYTIDRATDPRTVGEHTVISAQRLEANIPGAMADKEADETHDGGVQVTRSKKLSEAGYEEVFYGRLTDSPWSEARWTPARAPAP